MINPNAAVVLGFDALTRCICGAYDNAIEHAEKAMRLSPLEPLVYHAAFAPGVGVPADGPNRGGGGARPQGDRGQPQLRLSLLRPGAWAAPGSVNADEAAQAVRRLLGVAPGFRLGSLRKIRFADAARLQSDLDAAAARRTCPSDATPITVRSVLPPITARPLGSREMPRSVS